MNWTTANRRTLGHFVLVKHKLNPQSLLSRGRCSQHQTQRIIRVLHARYADCGRTNPSITCGLLCRATSLQQTKVGRDSHLITLNRLYLRSPCSMVPLDRSIIFSAFQFRPLNRINSWSYLFSPIQVPILDQYPQSQPPRSSLASGMRTSRIRYWIRLHNVAAASTSFQY